MNVLKAVIVSSFFMSIAQANTLYGISADANYWDSKVNETSHHYESDGSLMLSMNLEHGLPMIPHAHVKFTGLDTYTNMIGADISMRATNTDLIAYYEVLDNIVSADVGFGAKIIDGTYTRSGDGGGPPNGWNETVSELDQVLPMLYASADVKFPLKGLSAKVELGVAKGSDAKTTDAQAEIQYDFIESKMFTVGAKVGYRIMKTHYDSIQNKELDIEFKGLYTGMAVHF